jgi:hypothetical protein
VSGDGKEDRSDTPAFIEVDPGHSSVEFRRTIGRALALLEKSDSQVGRLTFASIRDGRVEIDELVDLTCADFERVRHDLSAVGLEAADWIELHEPDSEPARAIEDELDGYMWGNRIYVSRGQTAQSLAATLVHEVNHVINRSEVGYYDDLPTSAFLHEYRAFHVERMFDPAPWEGIDLVDHVITTYELDRDQIPARVLADPLSPRLLPDAASWRKRSVKDDPVDDDAACPALEP